MAILRGQRGNSDCGPTCFANALNILGYDIKISQANELCGLTKDGTDSSDLIKAFDKYGFECKEKFYRNQKRAWSWLVKDTSQGLPIILGVDDDSHWLLVLRAGKYEAQILDPGPGYDEPTKISKEELLYRWKYFNGKSSKPQFQGLKLMPYKDKAIKAVLVREKLLATIDVR